MYSNSNLDRLMFAANKAYAESRFGDCERDCQEILRQLPANIPALVLLGIAQSKSGNLLASVSSLEKAVAVDPRCAPAYQWLSMSLRSAGERERALITAEKAVQLNPGDALALHHLGQCQMDMGQLDAAEASVRRAAAIAPQVSVVHLTLGTILRAQNKIPEAKKSIRRAVSLDPNSVDPLVVLREILFDEIDPAGALEAANAIAKLRSRSAEAHLWQARFLLELNRREEADERIARALELGLETGTEHALLGWARQTMGQIDDARQCFERAIELNPVDGPSYLALVSSHKITEAERALVDRMDTVANDSKLLRGDRSQLEYALGKAYQDLENYPLAMEHFDKANRLDYEIKFGDVPYNRTGAQARVDLTIKTFDAKFLERNAGRGTEYTDPIFVVGMIRSGTTLVEQILSSHPSVGAAGEQKFWLENGVAVVGGAGIDAKMAAKFADRYVTLLHRIAPDTTKVVDKMPMNYELLGLLKLVFPNAKVIHLQRHPVDTCLSIYTTPNRAPLGWAGDKSNIVFNYRLYEKLMEHWRHVLPRDFMLEIVYEDLVDDLEGNARRMVEFCGLDWDDACLRPQENRRAVITPSVGQVRQPVYRTSLARWKKYEDVLGAFGSLIGR